MQISKAMTIRPLYERTRFHTSVISEVENEELREAYAICRAITKKHAKTFYLATRFLPNRKQRAVFAIYALCRFIDDTVDEAEDLLTNRQLSLQEIETTLDQIRFDVKQAFEFGKASNPIFRAICDTLKHYNIDGNLPILLIDGVYTDLIKKRFQTFEELYDYSYKVASVVGLMTSEVFGYTNPKALEYAIDLGIAMQLTNIIRDVGEDLDRGRIYIPQEDLQAFGVSEDELFNKKMTPNIKKLLKFQVDRARKYYESAERGIPMLERNSRLPVWLARKNYARILDKVEQAHFEVLGRRVYLSTSEKMSIVPSSFLRSYLL